MTPQIYIWPIVGGQNLNGLTPISSEIYLMQHGIYRDRKYRALEKSPDPGAPGEIGNKNPPAPGPPAFRINPITNQFNQKTNFNKKF